MTTGNLTIQDNDTVRQYVSVGESSFVFDFPILSSSELKVSRNQVLLVYGYDYSITGIGDDGGGTITLLLGASTPGDVWTLWQDMPIERLTGFSAGAATILGAALNAEFAARLRVEQQLRRELRNCLRIAPDDPVGGQDMILPSFVTRPGKFLAFDANSLPSLSSGTGADAGLREDLADPAIGNTLVAYKRTLAETTAVLVPVNYSVPSHEILGGLVLPSRYLTNAIPGTTDFTAILNTLADFCRTNKLTLQLEPATVLISGPVDCTGITVQGNSRVSSGGPYVPHIQCSSAQVDCLTSEGNSCFRDFFVHGGWDGVTAGQQGDLFSFVSPTATAYNIHIHNVVGLYAKKRLIYWEDGAYCSISKSSFLAAGLAGLVLAGSVNTTLQVDGHTQFGACPNGPGLTIHNGVNLSFHGVIIEDTTGVVITGNDNRSISFDGLYQENFTVPGSTFLDATGSSGIGITIKNCFGGGRTILPLTNWFGVFIDTSNSNIGLPVIPYGQRVVQADSGEVFTAVTGGVNFTAGTLALAAGTWEIHATLQMQESAGATMVRAGINITGTVTDPGLDISTNAGFREGRDEATSFGVNKDARLHTYTVVQLPVAQNMYLRGNLNFSAGSMAYRGFMTAVRL